MTLKDVEEYELYKCLYTILCKQQTDEGHTNYETELELPFNTTVKIEASQKKDLKTDIRGYIHNKIDDLETKIMKKNGVSFKDPDFIKLGIYNDFLDEIDDL